MTSTSDLGLAALIGDGHAGAGAAVLGVLAAGLGLAAITDAEWDEEVARLPKLTMSMPELRDIEDYLSFLKGNPHQIPKACRDYVAATLDLQRRPRPPPPSRPSRPCRQGRSRPDDGADVDGVANEEALAHLLPLGLGDAHRCGDRRVLASPDEGGLEVPYSKEPAWRQLRDNLRGDPASRAVAIDWMLEHGDPRAEALTLVEQKRPFLACAAEPTVSDPGTLRHSIFWYGLDRDWYERPTTERHHRPFRAALRAVCPGMPLGSPTERSPCGLSLSCGRLGEPTYFVNRSQETGTTMILTPRYSLIEEDAVRERE